MDTFYRKGYYDAGMVLQASENIITRDGSTVITGRYTNTGDGKIALFITKLNPFGAVVWSKKITNGSYNASIAIKGVKEMSNGNLVLIYSYLENTTTLSMHIILLNAAGNLSWAKKLPFAHDSFLNAQMTVTDNNDIIIAATIVVEEWPYPGNWVPLIIKMDNNGNIVYNRWFAGNTCSQRL